MKTLSAGCDGEFATIQAKLRATPAFDLKLKYPPGSFEFGEAANFRIRSQGKGQHREATTLLPMALPPKSSSRRVRGINRRGPSTTQFVPPTAMDSPEHAVPIDRPSGQLHCHRAFLPSRCSC